MVSIFNINLTVSCRWRLLKDCFWPLYYYVLKCVWENLCQTWWSSGRDQRWFPWLLSPSGWHVGWGSKGALYFVISKPFFLSSVPRAGARPCETRLSVHGACRLQRPNRRANQQLTHVAIYPLRFTQTEICQRVRVSSDLGQLKNKPVLSEPAANSNAKGEKEPFC